MGLAIAILSGCATVSKKLVDSPSAEDGHPIRFQFPHGKIGPGAASEAIWVRSTSDSDVVLKVQPKPIQYKTTWIGMHFPMIPAFFMPATDYYSDSDSLLKISVWIKSDTKVQVFPDSSRVVVGGKELTAIKSSIWGVPVEPEDSRKEEREETKKHVLGYNVWFPIDARKLGKYEFKVNVFKEGPVGFPKVICQRKWIRMEFHGH